jgi:cytosine/uracil/thiamine/allantoin permease
MLLVIVPIFADKPGALWACFLGFWLLNVIVVWRGVESIRHLLALVGLFVQTLHVLYEYAWFVGFFAAGLVYVALMRIAS